MPRLVRLMLLCILIGRSLTLATVICPHDGDVTQDGRLTPGDSLRSLQDFLATAVPPLDGCERNRADVESVPDRTVTPADSVCILERFLQRPSCLDNTLPVANAGRPQTVAVGATVQLDGRGPSDVNGDSLTLAWRLMSAPDGSAATLSDSTAVHPTFMADLAGEYVVQLEVNDGTADSDPDTVIIATANAPPVAAAGADQTVAVGATVQLDGRGSSDSDGNSLAPQWTFLVVPAGSAAVLADATSDTPSFVADVPGYYAVQLLVSDGLQESKADVVIVSTRNTRPVAVPGAAQAVGIGDTVRLNGRASHDVDGPVARVRWALLVRPPDSAAGLSDLTTLTPTFMADVAGIYVAQLIVNDGIVDSLPATVAITAQNRPPLAAAGVDQLVVEGETVQLDGHISSDLDGDALRAEWTLTIVPDGSTAILSDPTAVAPTFVADVPGLYVARLVVNDGTVSSPPDTVNITAVAFVDSDNDGTPDARDCAPNDVAIHPGVAEICGDNIDNDCSGFPDDKDADSDGFVDLACGGDDVDDDNILINPRVAEICNDGVDNDSNLLVDLADPVCAPGCDRDVDGHSAVACGGVDANDNNTTVFPGAPELCDDFLDNNLNGQIDEGCNPDTIAIGPQDVRLVASDSQVFIVLDDTALPTAWIFQVDGIAGGNATVGQVVATADDANQAVYIAPAVTETRTVTVSAVDLDNATRSASTQVTVLPLAGSFVIQPAAAIVPLGKSQVFQAGLDVAGIGVVPVTNVFWRVNNQLRGNDTIGRIDAAGMYRAPAVMPLSLPVAINVEFSLSRDGPVMASAPITLAQLIVTPDTLVGLTPGPVGTLSAMLRQSDNTLVPVPAVDLTFFSGRPDIATVDATGAVSIAFNIGRSVLLAVHQPTGAQDTAVVFSRSDVAVVAEVVLRTRDFARIERNDASGVTEIEFTRPGAMFNVTPSVTILRGQSAGTEIDATNPQFITFTGDEVNIVAFDDAEGEPDLTNLVAAVERRTGFVIMGQRPGSGTITVTYNDDFVQRSASITVIFSRVEVNVTVTGTLSGNTNEVFVTEFADFQIVLNNPNGEFIGETPIRVTLADGASFQVAYSFNVNSGRASGPFTFIANRSNSNTFIFIDTEDLLLTTASTADTFYPGDEVPASIRFIMAPKRGGEHRFRIAVDNDPGVPVQEFVLMVRQPALGLATCTGQPLASGDRVVANSAIRIDHRGAGVPSGASVFDLFNVGLRNPASGLLFAFAHNDPPVWEVTLDGTVQQVPVTDAAAFGGSFAGSLRQPGRHTVALRLSDRPDIRSEDLAINVVAPNGSFPAVAAAPINPQSINGDPIPRDNQLGAFHIELPAGAVIVPGVSIPVHIQTYSASGEARAIGHTRRVVTIQDGVRTVEESHSVIGIRITDPAFTIEGDLHPNSAGEIIFNLIPNANGSGGEAPGDVRLSFTPQIIGLETFNSLPVDETVFVDSVMTARTANPFGIADFSAPKDEVFLDQCLLLNGRGLAIDPRQLPVPSQRVRDAVAAGTLPAGSEQVRFTVIGTAGFGDAVARGLANDAVDFGPGVELVSSATRENGNLEITLNTDLALFDSGAASYGIRTITLPFNNGTVWQGDIEFFGVELQIPANHADKNLPLNGRHHNAHPVGTQVFTATPKDTAIARLELELRPSLLPGQTFRGAEVDQPLAGFSRASDSTEAEVVSDLRIDLFQAHNSFFLVFGNRTECDSRPQR